MKSLERIDKLAAEWRTVGNLGPSYDARSGEDAGGRLLLKHAFCSKVPLEPCLMSSRPRLISSTSVNRFFASRIVSRKLTAPFRPLLISPTITDRSRQPITRTAGFASSARSRISVPPRMRAVLIKDGKGPAENLYIGEEATPEPKEGQVQVRVRRSEHWLPCFIKS